MGRKRNTILKGDIMNINYNSICVDASCIGNPGTTEYKIVETKTKKIIYNSKKYKMGTNNIGEFLALVHGIALIKRDKSYEVIYSDSQTALAWVRKKKCNTLLSNIDPDLKSLIIRAEEWLSKNNINDIKIEKWNTKLNGEIPADFGRKNA